MKLSPIDNSKLFKEGLRIVKLLQQNGFKAFWVGGTVRDMLLKRTIDNLDIASSAKPEQTEKLLKSKKIRTKPVGKAYGTILAATKHGPIEITTFRKEGSYINRRHPQEVTYIEDYEEDSKRRDFTVNAIYYDPLKQELLDPQKGQLDIERSLIKFVGDPKKRIDEDALRMLRAARFSVQLGFKIEKNSFAAIKTRAKYIQQISGERVKSELDKILSLPAKASGVRLLDELGLLKFIMPEVTNLKKVFHKSKIYHLEGSVFEHTMLALENTPAGNTSLAYATLYHDTGKFLTATPKLKPEGMVNSFPAHEFVSGELFKKFSQRLTFSRKESNMILWITKKHMLRYAFIRDMGEQKKLSLAKHDYFPLLLELWRADALSNLKKVDGQRAPIKPLAWEEGHKLLANINAKKNLIKEIADGKIIMQNTKLKSGPRIGELKNILENKILYGEINNLSEAKKYLKNLAKHS